MALAVGLWCALTATPAAGQSKAPSATDKVVISGWALNMSNIATGANQTIQIRINSWSTPAQRKQLIGTCASATPAAMRRIGLRTSV